MAEFKHTWALLGGCKFDTGTSQLADQAPLCDCGRDIIRDPDALGVSRLLQHLYHIVLAFGLPKSRDEVCI